MGNRQGETLVTTGNDEWYTPSFYVEKARRVMGGIDLDPASCGFANSWIQATHFYTKKDNGLEQPWYGRVWINPPYGKLASRFTERALNSYHNGDIDSCIILINANALGAQWGQLVWCFDLVASPAGRIHFLNPRSERTSSTHGSLVGYVGDNKEAFREHFGDLGAIVQKVA